MSSEGAGAAAAVRNRNTSATGAGAAAAIREVRNRNTSAAVGAGAATTVQPIARVQVVQPPVQVALGGAGAAAPVYNNNNENNNRRVVEYDLYGFPIYNDDPRYQDPEPGLDEHGGYYEEHNGMYYAPGTHNFGTMRERSNSANEWRREQLEKMMNAREREHEGKRNNRRKSRRSRRNMKRRHLSRRRV
jgi:hypothetical protein